LFKENRYFYRDKSNPKMKKCTLICFLFIGILGYSQNWKPDFEGVKTQAIKENKNILLVFSGSDWCAPCIKLEKTIWQSEEFKKEAEQKWVIYKADFPKKKANLLASDVTASNKKLAERYNKSGNFPLVLLLDELGSVLGITGYKNVTPQEYIQLIHSFEK
jgi:thioredoxin-related protein